MRPRSTRRIPPLPLLLLLLATLSCSGSEGSPTDTGDDGTEEVPSLTITAPEDGTSVPEGTAVTFTATAVDPEDGDLSGSVTWTSDLDGALGTGRSVTGTLSVGTHTVVASVTDSGAHSVSATVTVMVEPDAPPTVSIDAPADGATVEEGTTVTLEGTATDGEDGDLSGSIEWSSDVDGTLGTGATVETSLSAGTHTITARVMDSGGQAAEASITLVVEAVTEAETCS